MLSEALLNEASQKLYETLHFVQSDVNFQFHAITFNSSTP